MTARELLEAYERWFSENPDPWDFDGSPYEQEKRSATIVACGPGPHRRVLELGAANGVLAAALATQSDALVAVEAVPTAARLARERLAQFDGANVVEGLVPRDVPPGPYDVVVASEILYYLDDEAYAATLEALPSWLASWGRLVAVHWRPTGPERPRSADAVHADVAVLPGLLLTGDRSTPDYRLSTYVRVPPS